MASQSAHFNLTKPASTDNYSLTVVNDNTDIIDTQMYNNQQSAAKVMVGATAQEDGESGRVPAPTSAERGKYLKGDGTWDTPSGGGGGSSTLDGLTDVNISSPTNGQALVYDATNQVWINGNVSGGGGSFTETPLFTGGTSGTRTFTLSSAFTNYDYIAIYYSHNDSQTTYQDVKLYPSSFLYSLIGTSVNILGITNDAWYYYFTVTSTTQLDYAKSNAGWITDVIGIKFGGGSGGGSGGITATVLANTLWSSAGTYTLNDDYDNYDILEIYFCNPSVANSESDLITVMVDDVKNLMDSSKLLNLTGYGDRYVNCTFSADEFTITASSSGGVQRIVGYKFNGGGGDIATVDFNDLTASQIATLKSVLGIS